jgi:hypothetical protein
MDISIKEILNLEMQVWEALRNGDSQLDEKMLSEDFLGVYPTGFSNRAEHVGQLKYGPTVYKYDLTDSRLLDLGENRVLISYKTIWIRLKEGEPQPPEVMFISSVWEHRAGRWVNIFSQDTPALIERITGPRNEL